MAEATRHCAICGEMLDPERAEYQPETRLCTVHAEQIRKFGGEFTVTLTEESLSKRGSMKGNRGDVSVSSKVRNHAALEKLRDEYERQTE